jgi:hypothetical protein
MMKKISTTIVAIILTFAIFFSSLPTALACGPFTVDPLFSFSKHLDYPIESYTNDKIGIVPKTYGRISLFVFYRQLNNLPFSEKEKTEVKRAIEYRIGIYTPDSEVENAKEPTADKNSAVERWKMARVKVMGGDTKTAVEKKNPDDYSAYSNCLDDAYANAAKALETRITKYGNTENVKEWLNGQDAVFSNCGEKGKIPENVADNSPDWLKKDRHYQIAAALFYNEKFPESRQTFEQIAADSNSVWKNTAKFVIARTYIRQASFIEEESITEEKKKEKVELLNKADTQLTAVIADSSAKDFHESAHRLLNLVRYRGNPPQQRSDLAEMLSQKTANPDIFNNLTDYVWLLDKVESVARDKGLELEQKQAEAEKKEYNYDYKLKIRDIDKAEMGKDLTDWLYSYQTTDSFTHSYTKWKETNRLAWFVAAIVKAEKNSPQLAELLSEAEKIQPNSPAYLTVRYHQIQLLLETNKRAEAKQKLNEIMGANFKNISRSSQNKFLAERMILAENLEDFLKYSQRQAAAFVWSDDGNEQGDDLKNNKELSPWVNRTMFDQDAIAFFNEKMSLSMLRQSALSPNLPEHLKKFLVIAVWTRAFILRNQEIEREFAPMVERYDKELAASFSKLNNSTNPIERESAAMLAVLRNPAIQPYVPVGLGRGDSPAEIDSIRGNWWCIDGENTDNYSHYDNYEFKYPAAYPDFLTADQKAISLLQHKQFAETGASASYLTKRALDFATKNPTNPNTPEMLHLAVRSTRYGCKDDATLQLSKASFDFLHKRFPTNEWTKKTPYYFGKQ